MEKKLKREIAALEDLFTVVERFCSQQRVEDSVIFTMKLAGEELFTNLVRHNEGGGDHILMELKRGDRSLVLVLTDYDVKPYDIMQTGPVDVTAPLAERSPGGLGLHLVKNVVDKLTYEYTDGTMKITAVKGLEGKHV